MAIRLLLVGTHIIHQAFGTQFGWLVVVTITINFGLSALVSALIVVKLLLNRFNDLLSCVEAYLFIRDIVLAPQILPLAEGFCLLLLQLHLD